MNLAISKCANGAFPGFYVLACSYPCWNVLFQEATFQILCLVFKVQLEQLCEALLAAWGLLVPPPLNSYSIVGDHLFGLQSNFILL